MPVVCSKQLKVPAFVKRLSDYAEGDIVRIHEGGTPVEFYVIKHDYEPELNGAGRTLLLRKDCYASCRFDEEQDDFADFRYSEIYYSLTNDYKSLFTEEVKTKIAETKFHRYPASSATTVVSSSVFLLSIVECGGDFDLPEGSFLPAVASVLATGKGWWTRSAYEEQGSMYSDTVHYVTATGTFSYMNCYEKAPYSRPCFTLPADTEFDSDTNTIK